MGIQKPPPTPKSFTFYVKPVVRWASMAVAAFTLTWTILSHMAAQHAQREQEASHQRCWSSNCRIYLLICCFTNGTSLKVLRCISLATIMRHEPKLPMSCLCTLHDHQDKHLDSLKIMFNLGKYLSTPCPSCQDLSACCRQVREILARMHQAEEQHSKRGVLDRLALASALNQKAAKNAEWEPEDKQPKPSGLLGMGDEPMQASGKPVQHAQHDGQAVKSAPSAVSGAALGGQSAPSGRGRRAVEQALGLATPPQGAEEAVS